ncbi:MAG: hybrid sensor histidine kinase/response regulator [Herminiimonas sp.]|nr:hybrid sensor histidine kinase/response regulator [Herminiimonas sp.]MDB5854035.1 hybrid sensor histidine kinase/response regulator [Herminiimonas sp.]
MTAPDKPSDEYPSRSADLDVDALMLDRESLVNLIRQLRDANQNLVLATVNAQTLRDEAEATNRRQSEFLAMLAHELRNPLAPIGMVTELLGRLAVANPDLPRLHAILKRQVAHMARMLDDLLDAARVSSGKIELDRSPVSLIDVLDHAVDASEPSITRRRQTLVRENCATDVVLDADPIRLTQVFSNLLLNASKYTQEGGEIRLVCKAQPDLLEISVEDNGTGIALDVLPHVFGLFVQGPRTLARPEGGLGIGLSVVRTLVQMHGGTVAAHSDGPGLGSRFTVTLPRLTQAEPARTAAVPAPSRECGRVLLIEDNVDASDTLREFLTLGGHTVTCALDGPKGLALAQSNDYDIILCDVGLPGMDGYELMRRLTEGGAQFSSQDGAHKTTPYTIALTGYGAPEDERLAREAGFNDYMVKPVDGRKLLSRISDWIARKGS